ncbi:Protein cwh43 [Grifola frondosa]|uniref:Protein cwh43 n=1 Tax=Grifola frondosa TaxID=5627 RepID=A0A1C7M7H4_GRIFR|nr:Protein cwh43 [Grifola frondosa]
MASRERRPGPLVLRAASFARVHTYFALTAFLSALIVGCLLHYRKIVKNGVAGYPEEWFPSVSATIGDWYPERNIFQILIAINSGPRFVLVFMQYYLHRTAKSSVPGFVMLVGILRTLSCGGWVYITSNDDHDIHDVLMIAYIVLNIPWMFGSIICTPVQYTQARRRRRLMASAFFISIIPMIYFFIQHKVHRVPGAYTRYSFFEWGLILFDILFDSSAELDFTAADLKARTLLPGAPETENINHSTTEFVPIATTEPNSSQLPKEPENEKGTSVLEDKPRSASYGVMGFKRLRPIANFLSDVYLSFIFWSIFTSLTPTLFYFSVWELGIAGQELSLLSSLSPILLAITPFLEWCRSREGRTILHNLSFAGLYAYALTNPLHRLLVVSFANAVVSIGAAVDWFCVEEKAIAYQGILMGLGFLLSSLLKHANHANNPVWPIVDSRSGGFNKIGIMFAYMAVLNFYMRSEIPTASKANTRPQARSRGGYWLPGAISLGSLIFTLHHLLSDSSTLITWSWTGYPVQGPVPNLHGSLTHVAQALGLSLAALVAGSSNSDVFSHPLWFAYGSASAYVMYSYKDWLGYAGGLNFAVFLMSVTPVILARSASTGRVAVTCFLAWLVVCLFDLATVWTVAYAFVPGGVYLRERTDIVLIAQMACLALGFRWPAAHSGRPTLVLPKSLKSYVQHLLAILSVLSLLATLYRWPSIVPQPHRPGPRIVRAGIWTVHFGIDNEGRDSQRRMRDLIKDMELDVVGLLETDLHRVVFGNRDLTRIMAEELGYFVDIGPAPNQHTWGAVLLSKFPIINSTHHLLPSPDGELAPAIEAVLDMYGTEVTVVVAHNGQEETPLDRELQATELAHIMSKSYPQPVIFLGYVVTNPLAARPAPYDIMVTDGRVHDIDKDDWDRWCEYIFYRGLYRTAYARVSRSTITDTELQIGQFVVPRHGSGVTNDTEEARYLRAWKEELPVDHWFPLEYYLEHGGRRGHHYHVFNTPLYYKLPEGAEL